MPAIKGEPLATRPYYVENYNGSKKAVVVDKQKLIFDKKANTFLRFDLATDPKENENLFEDGAEDRPLLGALYRSNPELVTDTPVIANLAAEKLAAVDPEAPGENLPYLVALSSRASVGGGVEPLTELFRKTPHDEVKLAVLAGLIEADAERAERLVTEYLPTLDGVREEQFVDGLADIGLGSIDLDLVRARLMRPALADATVRAWLRWLERWKKPEVGAVLAELARRETQEPGTFAPATLALLASVIGNADLDDQETALTQFNRELLSSTSARVRYAAIQTVAALGDEAALPRLIELARSKEVRDRQATIHALVALQGEAAVPLVVEIAKDPNLILDAIKALPKTKSKDALPFLQEVADTHFNRIIQNYARRAIKKLE